jgi:hypothetical protein
VIGIQTLLVETVPDLMKDGEQSTGEVVRVEPQDEPAVSRPDSGTTGVNSEVESSAGRVKPKRYCDCLAEGALLGHRKRFH